MVANLWILHPQPSDPNTTQIYLSTRTSGGPSRQSNRRNGYTSRKLRYCDPSTPSPLRQTWYLQIHGLWQAERTPNSLQPKDLRDGTEAMESLGRQLEVRKILINLCYFASWWTPFHYSPSWNLSALNPDIEIGLSIYSFSYCGTTSRRGNNINADDRGFSIQLNNLRFNAKAIGLDNNKFNGRLPTNHNRRDHDSLGNSNNDHNNLHNQLDNDLHNKYDHESHNKYVLRNSFNPDHKVISAGNHSSGNHVNDECHKFKTLQARKNRLMQLGHLHKMFKVGTFWY